MLSFERVCRSYRRGARLVEALRDVSFELEPGELVAIHGGMRAGKSTLLRIAAGHERPDSGAVRYRGMDLAQMSVAELARYRRSEVGLAECHDRALEHLAVRDYVALPLMASGRSPRAGRHVASRVLERVGLDLSGEERVAELSEQERWRVELAHVLVREPKIVLADEPVVAADANFIESAEILELLLSIARDDGCAVMVSAAKAPAAMRATQIIGLDRGQMTTAQKPGGEVVHFPTIGAERRHVP